MKWLGRLTLAFLSVFVLARAAAAQDHVEGYGYEYGYETVSASARTERYDYREDRYGSRASSSASGYDSGYATEYGSASGYRDEYVRREPETCDWTRPADPRDPYACPPGWGVVTLNDSFFHGGGGVGPEYIAGGGGGGGGYAVAGAGAGAYAYAGASASARVSIGGRGGWKGHGGKPRGGRGGGKCGCH